MRWIAIAIIASLFACKPKDSDFHGNSGKAAAGAPSGAAKASTGNMTGQLDNKDPNAGINKTGDAKPAGGKAAASGGKGKVPGGGGGGGDKDGGDIGVDLDDDDDKDKDDDKNDGDKKDEEQGTISFDDDKPKKEEMPSPETAAAAAAGDDQVQADENGSDNPLAAIDSACKTLENKGEKFGIEITPPNGPLAKTAPDDCRTGIEFNRLMGSSFNLNSATGSRAIELEIDVASYTAPDRMRLIADNKLILDTCRLRTSKIPDPTNGKKRPPEDTIRFFRVKIAKGTKTIRFAFGEAKSPTYMRVVGLCDFELSPVDVVGNQPNLRVLK